MYGALSHGKSAYAAIKPTSKGLGAVSLLMVAKKLV